MASTTSKPAKLGQLLQQQQEPFALEVYLIERGYLKKKKKKSSKTEEKLGCFKSNGNSRKFLSRSTSSGLNKTRKVSKLWRAIRNKLVCTNRSQSFKNSEDKEAEFSVHEFPRNGQQVSESDSFSSASSATVYNSCSESDRDETPTSFHKHHASLTAETFRALKLHNMKEKMAAADRKFQRRFTEENKQHSPVSVLEAIPSRESSPLHNTQLRRQESGTPRCIILPTKVTEDSVLSASLWELLFHSASEKPIIGKGVSELMELVRSNPSTPQLLKSKRMLQQTRQLLFDCVRELVESHATEEGEKQRCREFLGPEELGKLLSQKMKGWSKHGGDHQTNITHLLDSDFCDSTQEWTGFHPEKREIGLKIGDAILDEIMNEIVNC